MGKRETVNDLWSTFSQSFQKIWYCTSFIIVLLFLWIPVKKTLVYLGVDKTGGLVPLTITIHFGIIILILAITFFITLFRIRKEMPNLDIESFKTLEYLSKLDSLHLGIIRVSDEAISEINDDFSATHYFKTTIKDIGGSLSCIEHFACIPSRPDDVDKDILVLAEKTKIKDIQIIPEMKYSSPYEAYWILHFKPPLKENEELSIDYKHTMPPNTYLKDYSMLAKRNLQSDFTSDVVRYPTEHFMSKVIFPVNFTPQETGYDVWFGRARARHQNEFHRLFNEKCFEEGRDKKNRLWISLNIYNPIHALIYALTWVPPN